MEHVSEYMSLRFTLRYGHLVRICTQSDIHIPYMYHIIHTCGSHSKTITKCTLTGFEMLLRNDPLTSHYWCTTTGTSKFGWIHNSLFTGAWTLETTLYLSQSPLNSFHKDNTHISSKLRQHGKYWACIPWSARQNGLDSIERCSVLPHNEHDVSQLTPSKSYGEVICKLGGVHILLLHNIQGRAGGPERNNTSFVTRVQWWAGHHLEEFKLQTVVRTALQNTHSQLVMTGTHPDIINGHLIKISQCALTTQIYR